MKLGRLAREGGFPGLERNEPVKARAQGARDGKRGLRQRWGCLLLSLSLLALCACGGVSSGAVPEPPSQEAPTQSETPPAQSPSEEGSPGVGETFDGGVSTVETPGNGNAITGNDPALRGSGPPADTDAPTPKASAKPMGTLEEEVEKVMASILTDAMTKREQARAIFDYVRGNVRYSGKSDKSSVEAAAYEGLSTRQGDCYTYYALSQVMLTAAGIDNLEVRRTGGDDDHWWNLVNCGDGWYHFDASPRNKKMRTFDSFMFTDEQAAEYTETVGRNYYDFDESLYPARAGGGAAGGEEPPTVPETPAVTETPAATAPPTVPEHSAETETPAVTEAPVVSGSPTGEEGAPPQGGDPAPSAAEPLQ